MHPTAKMSEEMNRKCHPRNTTIELTTPAPTLSATMHSVADRRTDRLTDRRTYDSVIEEKRSAYRKYTDKVDEIGNQIA